MLCDVLGNEYEDNRDGWLGEIAGGIIFMIYTIGEINDKTKKYIKRR
jgi:hypothetical protein